MKKLIWLTLTLLVSGTLLSSCAWFSFACEPFEGGYGGTSPTETNLDRSRAEVGESVAVTLSASLQLPTCSHLTEQVWHDLTLGACFARLEGEQSVSKGGFCEPSSTPPPDGITLLENTSHIRKFGDYGVKRGETNIYRHTFTFTATEPGTFRLNGFSRASGLGDRTEEFYYGGDEVLVVFE